MTHLFFCDIVVHSLKWLAHHSPFLLPGMFAALKVTKTRAGGKSFVSHRSVVLVLANNK